MLPFSGDYHGLVQNQELRHQLLGELQLRRTQEAALRRAELLRSQQTLERSGALLKRAIVGTCGGGWWGLPPYHFCLRLLFKQGQGVEAGFVLACLQ